MVYMVMCVTRVLEVLRKYFNQYIEFAIIERIESIILAPWCSG